METTQLAPHLQRMVDAGVSGTDILHGELKNLMLIAETEYLKLKKRSVRVTTLTQCFLWTVHEQREGLTHLVKSMPLHTNWPLLSVTG